MSADLISWVYDHSPYYGTTFTLHLVLADLADNRHQVSHSQGVMATRSRLTPKTVRAALDHLVADGFLSELPGIPSPGGGNPIRRFLFEFPGEA